MKKSIKAIVSAMAIFVAIVFTVLGIGANSTQIVANNVATTTTSIISTTSTTKVTVATTTVTTPVTTVTTSATTVTTPVTTVTTTTEIIPTTEQETSIAETEMEIIPQTETEETDTEEIIDDINYEEIEVISIELNAEPIVTKTNDEIVSEVIHGQWGNGTERKDKLTAAGYDYDVIQELINALTPPPLINSNNTYLSDNDRYYLAVMLNRENSPRASAAHNAQSVAAMCNRVRDGWATSIYNAINTGCVPWWGGRTIESFSGTPESYCYEAIDYFLEHSTEYPYSSVHSWSAAGDDIHNVYY